MFVMFYINWCTVYTYTPILLVMKSIDCWFRIKFPRYSYTSYHIASNGTFGWSYILRRIVKNMIHINHFPTSMWNLSIQSGLLGFVTALLIPYYFSEILYSGAAQCTSFLLPLHIVMFPWCQYILWPLSDVKIHMGRSNNASNMLY